MKTEIQLHLFGSLQKNLPSGQFPCRMTLDAPVPLSEIFARKRIPEDRVQLVMVNHRAVSKDTVVYPGDRISLFPKEYAIFADWKDFRS